MIYRAINIYSVTVCKYCKPKISNSSSNNLFIDNKNEQEEELLALLRGLPSLVQRELVP